jgi:hypothetical protein
MTNTLRPDLHREFFTHFKAGTKRIEYRRRTSYWRRRLEGRHYVVIQSRTGYYAICVAPILTIKRWRG